MYQTNIALSASYLCLAAELQSVHGRTHSFVRSSITTFEMQPSCMGQSICKGDLELKRPLRRRARDKETGVICALKRIKMEKEKEGFPLTSIREINILLSFQHSNIVDVSEVVVGDNLDQIFMVMEFMEHDLKGLMDDMIKPFTIAEVRHRPLISALLVFRCQFPYSAGIV